MLQKHPGKKRNMISDPIGDLLIRLKNANMAGRSSFDVPHSRIKHEILLLLAKESYIERVEKTGVTPKITLHVTLRKNTTAPVLINVKRMSKPGLRRYVNHNQIPRVLGGMGMAILSTPKGIMSDKQARKEGIGGELICEIW